MPDAPPRYGLPHTSLRESLFQPRIRTKRLFCTGSRVRFCHLRYFSLSLMAEGAAMSATIFLLEADLLGFRTPLCLLFAACPIALVATFVQIERLIQHFHVVETSRSLLMEHFEVRGIHEVGHGVSVRLEELLLHRVCRFVVIQAVLFGPGGVEVGGGIDQHLGQLVRGGDAYLVLLLQYVP